MRRICFWHSGIRWIADTVTSGSLEERGRGEGESGYQPGPGGPLSYLVSNTNMRPAFTFIIKTTDTFSYFYLKHVLYLYWLWYISTTTLVHISHHNCICLSLVELSRDDLWLAEEREERIAIDRDQFLRTRSVVTRSGRHQTASPACDMWDPASRDQGPPTLLRCPRCPHCPGHCASHVITGAAWQAGAHGAAQSKWVKIWPVDGGYRVPSHIFLLP